MVIEVDVMGTIKTGLVLIKTREYSVQNTIVNTPQLQTYKDVYRPWFGPIVRFIRWAGFGELKMLIKISRP